MKLDEYRRRLLSGSASEKDVKNFLEQFDIEVPKGLLIRDIHGNVDLSYPLVLKVSDPSILHKTDVGGVRTGIPDYEALIRELSGMRDMFPGREFLVEEMADPGLEVIIGVIRDQAFGPVIMLGMGGVYTELYNDTVFRLLPIDEADADDMIESIGIRRFIKGFRNIRISRAKLIGLLLKISDLVGDLGEALTQLDLNPVILTEEKAIVVDAKLI